MNHARATTANQNRQHSWPALNRWESGSGVSKPQDRSDVLPDRGSTLLERLPSLAARARMLERLAMTAPQRVLDPL